MFSEIIIACSPYIPAFLQFSTPNKTFSTASLLSPFIVLFHLPYSFVFPRIQFVFLCNCLTVQYSHLGTCWHRQKSFQRGKKPAEKNPLWLARYRKSMNIHLAVISVPTIIVQLSKENPKAQFIPFASFFPSSSPCCPWKSPRTQTTQKCLP